MMKVVVPWLATALLGCGGGNPVLVGNPPIEEVKLDLVASGLTAPVHLAAPTGDVRLFVVEQSGRIRIIQDGQLSSVPFLDITNKVSFGGEQGLFSVAFHPQYATNGYFFVNYTDVNGDTRIERYQVSNDPDRANPASARLILSVAQPASNHNGGHILFGPDGMLYIAMGDGGGAGDPQNHAQNRADLLGDLLRIDVDNGDPYAIPADNPFRELSSARGEIWAYGLRNPWRIAFDRVDGVLYIADVGQNRNEEINAVDVDAAGLNYGWRVMEGSDCYNPNTNCNRDGLTLPVLQYSHGGGNCSVTGGIVYRGARLSNLRGHYFYSDFCAGWIRSFRLSNGQATDQRTWSLGSIGQIMSYGEDAAGEMYILSSAGRVYRFTD